jgi:MFS family permease
VSTPRIFKPLRIRDFALLWTGLSVSLLGDGIYLVAIAWQVYELSNAPTALSIVGVAWTIPLVLFILLGGVVSDRFERRKVMIAADLVRAAAIGTMAALSLAGTLELWHVVALVGLYGVGEAFFGPAYAAFVPDIVPRHLLVEANALAQFVNPLALRMAGPALGGAAVAALGAGGAFLLDAGSFAFSAGVLCLMRSHAVRRAGEITVASAIRDIGEGFRFVRSQVWLWGTLLAASVSLLAFWGPVEVLVPYVVKNTLDGGAGDLGLVFGAGGLGAVLAALAMAQWGLPRRHVTLMYASWTASVALIALYGVVTALWQAMVVSFVEVALGAVGLVVWQTMMQRLVPRGLRGRVESADWLVSVSLVPVSFALTGPIAHLAGVPATLVGAGLIGAALTLVFLFLPRMRETERDGSLRDAAGEQAVPPGRERDQIISSTNPAH